MAIASTLLLLSVSPARAEPPAEVKVEVTFLLGYVENSGCEFSRNGTWYDAKAARAHLDRKYSFLAAIDMISTTEDFIEKTATESSYSGQPYEVRCNGGPTVASGPWLRSELVRHRAR